MQGFLVTVEGDYFGTPMRNDRKKEKFPYKVQVKVPKPSGALSLIKNKLLDKVLQRNYSNYHTYRTHQLTSITNLDGSKVHGLTDPRLMDFNDLAIYVAQHQLPLKLELYTDLDYFRKMVYLAQTNQREFRAKQDLLEKEVDENKALAALNPELEKPLEPPLTLEPSQGGIAVDAFVKPVQPSLQAQQGAAPIVNDKTVIIDGKQPEVDGNQKLGEVLSAPGSNMVMEEKPATQKVEKVYVPGQGYVDSKDFKEDFNREDEKEFETYDPTGAGKVEAATSEVAAEANDPGETETVNVDEL